MSDADDERLRKAMEVLRADDAGRVPDFRAMADKPEPPRALASRLRRAGPALGSLAVAAAVLAVWIGGQQASAPPPMAAAPAAPPPVDLSGTAPRVAPSRDDLAPLDFLLGDARGAGAFVASGAHASSLDFLVTKDPAR